MTILKSICLIAFVFSTAHASTATTDQSSSGWNLNDVSYLLQIPQAADQDQQYLLLPESAGEHGVLLPTPVQQLIPTLLNAGNGNPTLFSGAVRVIAVRIDPCPNMEEPTCSPEIRMVWQPIEFDDRRKKWLARDGAVHSFYKLSPTQFTSAKSDLWNLKKIYEKKGINTHLAPLSVHPAIANPDTAKTFTQDLNTILLKYCGEKNLAKVTFMSVLVPTRWWRFGSFITNSAGEWVTESIPRIDSPIIDIFNVGIEEDKDLLRPGKAMNAIFNIIPEDYPEEDEISPLINKSYRFDDDRDKPIFEQKLNAVARFRNPHKTSSSTLDCASCHYADAAKFYAGERFPVLKNFVSADSYQNPNPEAFNLKNTTVSKEATRVLRAFGFFADQPAILQRTIHDSAESAHWLNTH